jgi:hypothetical protein
MKKIIILAIYLLSVGLYAVTVDTLTSQKWIMFIYTTPDENGGQIMEFYQLRFDNKNTVYMRIITELWVKGKRENQEIADYVSTFAIDKDCVTIGQIKLDYKNGRLIMTKDEKEFPFVGVPLNEKLEGVSA